MRSSIFVILAVGSLLTGIGALVMADDAKEAAIKKDRKKYEGTWRVISLEINGNKAAEEDARKITVVNKADGTWVLQVDGNKITEGTSEIDPTKKPKTIDFTPTEGENKGKTALGITSWRMTPANSATRSRARIGRRSFPPLPAAARCWSYSRGKRNSALSTRLIGALAKEEHSEH